RTTPCNWPVETLDWENQIIHLSKDSLGSSSIPGRPASTSPLFTDRRLTFISVFFLLLSGIILADDQMVRAQSPLTYYVDCAVGNDAYTGTSPAQAWKSMAKANKAPLQPGD